ncbi:MAG: YbdK family carboxylate-amine ligase [Actinomycetota bacterium]|nr:YbdK family carboxylate-amine ligase [Actinomycetota bacterium]
MSSISPSCADLKATFDQVSSPGVGLEEEVMLLDPESFELAPCAPQVLSLLGDDPRFKLELPAAQLEIVTSPCRNAQLAADQLAAARTDLRDALDGRLRAAAAGAHPFSDGVGVLNSGPRYDAISAEYGSVARRQLVFALHVHVAISGADRALAVYNALRCYLPELAALAGNAPFYEGRDTGLASVRPKLCELLPRQGVPPEIASWPELAAALRWGAASGRFKEPRQWWWELRLHPLHGTLELRVPDAQSTAEDTAAVAAVAQALVADLAQRYDADENLPSAATWQIEENRWSACRFGLEGELSDLLTGERTPTRERLLGLLESLDGHGARLGCAAALVHARAMVDENGAVKQRRIAAAKDLRGLMQTLSDAFAPKSVSPDTASG